MAQIFLKVMSGPNEGTNIPLKDEVVIVGRRDGSVVIPDPLISSKHAKFYKGTDGNWYIEDLQSRNGLSVNGRLVQRAQLTAGTEINMGNTNMILFMGESVEEQPSPFQAPPVESKMDSAWMLDEELVRHNNSNETLDVISNELRLPLNFQAEIEVVNGSDMGKVFPVNGGTMTIGRNHGEIPLSDLEVSRKHAIIEFFSRDMIFLRDLKSTNGTYHNGRSIDASKLQNSDTIGLGSSLLRLRIRS